MAQNDVRKLDSGDAFPEMEIDLLDRESITVKAALGGSWSVLLFYRGYW